MNTLWILLALVAISVGEQVLNNDYRDIWEYEDTWYDEAVQPSPIASDDKPLEVKQGEDSETKDNDSNVEQEIQLFRKELEEEQPVDDLSEFEHDISEDKDQADAEVIDDLKPSDSDGSFEVKDNDDIFEDTQGILYDDDIDNDSIKSLDAKDEDKGSLENIVEETKKLLEDSDSSFVDEVQESEASSLNNDYEEKFVEESNPLKENDNSIEEINNISFDKDAGLEQQDNGDSDEQNIGLLEANGGSFVEEMQESEEGTINNDTEEKLTEESNPVKEKDQSVEEVEDISVEKHNDSEEKDNIEFNEQGNVDEHDVDLSNLEQSEVDALLAKIFKDVEMDSTKESNSEEKVDTTNEDADEKPLDSDEDTVPKVFADLKDDLTHLFETVDKLTDKGESDEVEEEKFDDTNEAGNDEKEKDNSETESDVGMKNDEGNDDSSDSKNEEADADEDDVINYEEKYGKPYRESNILQQREDYYDSITQTNGTDTSVDESFEDSEEKSVGSEETSIAKAEAINDDGEPLFDINNAWVESEENKDYEDSDEKQKEESAKQDIELKTDTKTKPTVATKTINDEEPQADAIRTINVENLTPEQYVDVMEQFKKVHSEDLDTQSEDFSKHVAPIHMKLSVDEVLEVTSPNYPSAYPTNNIVDWIFDGEGRGIELNITDFAVNGAMGDYLMVKPGGFDDTGSDGLIFSYQLQEERRYRFLNVDQMFMRFESKPGLGFLRGFKLSLKMIAPPEEEPEPVPEPEPVLPPVVSALTVSLGGLTAQEFLKVREDFRQLIADMATMYINANSIELGANETTEVAQVTGVSVCNVNWPNFENCAEVKFGVPLVYEDEDLESHRLNEQDLRTMWSTYIYQDPFALRLRRMGVQEFAMPNDQRILLVWLLIAAGALVSAALLAGVLWRYSCIDNYTRMPSFSDSASLQYQKRGLDLYPTPNQTLPPMYSDTEYKWDDAKYDDSTRVISVDMGGFANVNYVRDDLYDVDSDEDTIAPRDKNAGISARDIYKV